MLVQGTQKITRIIVYQLINNKSITFNNSIHEYQEAMVKYTCMLYYRLYNLLASM